MGRMGFGFWESCGRALPRLEKALVARTHNQKSMRKHLQAHGWTETLGGRHVIKMTKPGHRPITLPMHGGRDYSRGLTASILRQAGVS
jgi:predicted RNA binding protein YcfA (HicA-like mRNA interferase family)